jgi:putative membrane protein
VSPQSQAGKRSFIEHPFAWLVLAIGLLIVPITGYMLESEMPWEQVHPAINAMLNGSCAIFLVAGKLAISSGNRDLHKRCMLAGFITSALFLASYLARFAMSGTHRYPGHGWDKTLYLVILFSHMVLALVLVPMVLRTLYFGLKERFDRHRGIARYTFPVWLYVSVTGVLVYLMLYHFAEM